jgi:hypothetical protein
MLANVASLLSDLEFVGTQSGNGQSEIPDANYDVGVGWQPVYDVVCAALYRPHLKKIIISFS